MPFWFNREPEESVEPPILAPSTLHTAMSGVRKVGNALLNGTSIEEPENVLQRQPKRRSKTKVIGSSVASGSQETQCR